MAQSKATLVICILLLSPHETLSRIGGATYSSQLPPVEPTSHYDKGQKDVVDQRGLATIATALPSNRINNGHKSAPREYAFYAEPWWKGSNQGCGGTLIASKWILTAGHCVAQFHHSGIIGANGYPEWRIGSYCADTDNCGAPRQVIGSKRAVVHPQANYNVLKWDYALIELQGTASVAPVQLDEDGTQYDSLIAGSNVRTIGMGRMNDNGGVSTYLMEVDVFFLPLDRCRGAFSTGSQFDESVMCTNGANFGPCVGDSGGPMMIPHAGSPHGYIQVGVASFGAPWCENHSYPEGSARIDTAMQWIRGIVCPSYKEASDRPRFCSEPGQRSSGGTVDLLPPTPTTSDENGEGASCEKGKTFFHYKKRKHRKCSKIRRGSKKDKICDADKSDALQVCRRECGGCS